MRTAIFGSSTALHVRPPRRDRSEGTYVDLLRNAVQALDPASEVFNLARGTNIVTHETELGYRGTLQRLNPDVVILHFGINEAAPRVLPFGLWMWLHGPQACGRLKRWISYVLIRTWPVFMWIFHLGGWVGPEKFGKHLERLITTAQKECHAEVLVLNIGAPSKHFCRLLPRIEKFIPQYNTVLADVVRSTGAVLVDIWSMVNAEGLEKAQPDGCHLSAHGHRCVFEMIWNELVARGLIPAGAGAGRPSIGTGKPGVP